MRYHPCLYHNIWPQSTDTQEILFALSMHLLIPAHSRSFDHTQAIPWEVGFYRSDTCLSLTNSASTMGLSFSFHEPESSFSSCFKLLTKKSYHHRYHNLRCQWRQWENQESAGGQWHVNLHQWLHHTFEVYAWGPKPTFHILSHLMHSYNWKLESAGMISMREQDRC